MEQVQQALLYAMSEYGNARYEEGYTDGQEILMVITNN